MTRRAAPTRGRVAARCVAAPARPAPRRAAPTRGRVAARRVAAPDRPAPRRARAHSAEAAA
jgi:hypothetical protein